MSSSGDGLRRIAERAGNQGAKAAAGAMAAEGRRGIREELAKRSHPRGTPTPSAPGQPPARISGHLWERIIVVAPRQEGAHRWVAHVGPDGVIYARIQDRGGVAGRGHRTVIPPRPYMAPGAAASRQAARDAGVAAFRAVVHGR